MNVYNDVAKEFTLKSNEIQYFKTIIVPQLLQVLERNEMSSEVIINAKKVLTTFFNNPRNTNDNYPKGRYWNRDQDIKSLCNQPLTTAMILQNGDVMPCCVLENKYSQTMGNIMQSSLEDIWNGEKYKLFREKRSAFCYFCPSAQNMTIGFVPSMLRQF
jgi:radical SAM protein with 4Fe4S-binding SPASM domain